MSSTPVEDLPMPTVDPPASVGRRVAGDLVTGLATTWPLLLAVVILFADRGETTSVSSGPGYLTEQSYYGPSPETIATFTTLYLFWLVWGLAMGLVNWWATATHGWTVGQRAVGVRVLDEVSGTPIGWGRAFVRHLVFVLLSVTGVGLLANAVVMAGDRRGRGLQDRVGRTVAVHLTGRSPGARTPTADPARAARATGPREEAPSGPPSLATPQPLTTADTPMAKRSPLPCVAPAVQDPAAPAPSAPPAPAPAMITAVPGMAPAAPGTQPPPPPAAAPADPAPTGPARPGAGTGLVRLRTAGGAVLPRVPRLLVGRDPGQDGDAIAMPLDDPARSLSKTHAAFVRDGEALTVEDLHSTNGVALERADGSRVLAPGAPEALEPGDVVWLGDIAVHVEAL